MDIYIKGRYDYGVGKCAVVVVDNGEVVYQKAKVIGDKTITYRGITVENESINCEILAAICGVMIAKMRGAEEVTIYGNTKYQKWYSKHDYPEGRTLMRVFDSESRGMTVKAEFIPKADENKYNQRVNTLALNTIVQ